MSSETTKVKGKLMNLSSSLRELESLLEPLLAQPLPDTIISLETLQQAKIQTLLPYLIYDLVFIFLKSKGIDPKTHPVVQELERVRQYFEKTNNAQAPPAKRTELDKEAANRFIKHAIAQVSSKNATPQQDTPAETTIVPAKVTTKMIARAQYEQALQKQTQNTSDEEETLEIYHGPDSSSSNMDTEAGLGDHASGNDGSQLATATSQKRRRPPVDPFAGYGDDNISTSRSKKTRNIDIKVTNKEQKKKRSKKAST